MIQAQKDQNQQKEEEIMPIQRKNLILKYEEEIKEQNNQYVINDNSSNSQIIKSESSVSCSRSFNGKQIILDLDDEYQFDILDNVLKSKFLDLKNNDPSEIMSESQLSASFSYNGQLKNNQSQNQKQEEYQILYFEFDIQQIKDLEKEDLFQSDLTLLEIKDVSQIVNFQMKLSDMIYQEAIENNFSHEQMTPLNLIKASSQIIKQKVFNMFLKQENQIENNMNEIENHVQKEKELKNNKKDAKNTLKILSGSEQATQSLWFYNRSQIQRMKISKNEFKIKETECQDIIKIIQNVLWPFQNQTLSQNINVYLFKKINFKFKMIADWTNYQLILFNFIQNSAKYNNYKGDIVLLLSCKPLKENNKQEEIQIEQQNKIIKKSAQKKKYVLQTDIIDSGIGISEERQDLLFIPFLELKCMQGLMKRPENDNIGLGLASSKAITVSMGGDIRLKKSVRGLTVFQFKIPLLVQKDRNAELAQCLYKDKNCIQIYGEQRQLNQKVHEYLESKGFDINTLEALNISLISQIIPLNNSSIHSQIINKSDSSSPNQIRENRQLQIPQTLKIKRRDNSQQIEYRSGNLQLFNQNFQYKNKAFKDIKGCKFGQGLQRINHHLKSKSGDLNNFVQRNNFLENSDQDIIQSLVQDPEINLLMHGISNYQISSNRSSISVRISQKNDQNKQNTPLIKSIQQHQQKEEKQEERQNSISNKNSFQSRQIINQSQIDSKNNNQEQEHLNIIQIIPQPDNQIPIVIEQENINQRLDYQNLEKSLKQKKCIEILQMNHENDELQYFYEQEQQIDFKEESSEFSDDFLQPDQNQKILFAEFNEDKSLRKIDSQDIGKMPNVQIVYDIDVNSRLKTGLSQNVIIQQNSQMQRIQNQQINQQSIPSINSINSLQQVGSDKSSLKKINSQISKNKNSSRNLQQQDSIQQNNMDIASERNIQLKSIRQSQEIQFQEMHAKGQKQKNFLQGNNLDILREEEKEESVLNSQLQVLQFNNQQDILKKASNEEQSQQIEAKEGASFNNISSINPSNNQLQKNSFANFSNNSVINFSLLNRFNCSCKPSALFVDDNIFNLLAAISIFKSKYPYDVEQATCGAMAIDLVQKSLQKTCNCKNRTYKIIFMDLQMPQMEGTEASEKILKLFKNDEDAFRKRNMFNMQRSSNQVYQNIQCTIVALSAYTGDFHKQRATNSGMKDYITKPLAIDDLVRVMNIYFMPLIGQNQD